MMETGMKQGDSLRRHRLPPHMRGQYKRMHRFVGMFLGIIVLCLFANAGLIRTWWTAMEHSSQRLTMNGVERRYELTVPRQAKTGSVPLVIFLHGTSMTAKVTRYRFGLDDVAEREGFAIAYPEGIRKRWNVVPPAVAKEYPQAAEAVADMDFILALVDELVKKDIVDKRRVYLAGLSGGGRMTFLMACTHPEKFAAVAPLLAAMPLMVSKHCKTAGPLPVLMMDSTDDTRVDLNGGMTDNPARVYLPLKDSVDFWRRANKCSDIVTKKTYPHLRPDDPTSLTSESNYCQAGTKVMLYLAKGGGHQTPSLTGDDLWTPMLGPRNHDVEAAEELWKFFEGYRR
jgi:polyhydroxybutyrate depolymerase